MTTEYTLENISTLPLQLKHDYPGYKLRAHHELKLFKKNVKLVKESKKITTIRYEKDTLRYPVTKILQLIETSHEDPYFKNTVGTIGIKKIVVKRFGDLNDDDAMREGVRLGVTFLKEALKTIYGEIKQDELISIYYFE
ncbi:ASCH domain-containing protein [Candidatus Woesearchaeota archaeon]|nr:ASCH domain-containing protein [Candidatus Woesearchaeota archaeon]